MFSTVDRQVAQLDDGRPRHARPTHDTLQELSRMRELTAHADRRIAERASIIVAALEGKDTGQIAQELQLSTLTVYKWRRRYREQGEDGLRDRPRRGQPRKLGPERVDELAYVTQHCVPPRTAFWSIRRLAAALGVTAHQVRRAWAQTGIDPRTFRGRHALEELLGISKGHELLGLCIAPPHNALLLGTAGSARAPLPSSSATNKLARAAAHLGERRGQRGSLWAAFDASAGDLTAMRSRSPDALLQLLTRALNGTRSTEALELVISARESLHDFDLAALLVREPRVSSRVIAPCITWLSVVDGFLHEHETRFPIDSERVNARRLRESLAHHASLTDPSPLVWMAPRLGAC